MRFWIREANGTLHDGVNVHGSGGILRGKDAEAKLRIAIEQATNGEALLLYEPKPGHAHGYYAKWFGRACERDVDLRGAVIERAADEPLPDIQPTEELLRFAKQDQDGRPR